MISKYINLVVASALTISLAACSSSSSSLSAGTSVGISIGPSPAIATAMPAGPKTFVNDLNDTIVLTKAYLVISSATIEQTICGPSFTAALDGLLDIIIPPAYAHTTPTPTSTGIPYVINILGEDGVLTDIGSISPPPADYCGVTIDMLAADADARDLPVGAGEPDMVDVTLFVEGSYTLNAGGTGSIDLSTGATLIPRELLLSALMMISPSNLNGTVNMVINYDRWFDAVDMSLLETEIVPPTDSSSEGFKVLQNVTDSIHQQ